MMRLAGLMAWSGIFTVVLTGGCHKQETRYVFVASPPAAPAPVAVAEPAPAVEAQAPVEPAPAPAIEAAPAPAPVVVAPAPLVVAPAPAPAVGITFFHEQLGHHGHWVTVASYGQVWVPAGVAVGWQPYTVGHWVYTDAYGWMWVSDESWGEITCHYGRWVFVEPQGWVWVPGTVWGPAWVVWRSGGGYVGWAPMPAEVVVAEPRPAVELNINIGVGVVDHIRPSHWVFVHEAHILEPVHAHIIKASLNVTIIKETHHSTDIKVVGGHFVNRSLQVREVERVTGHPVRALRVREVETSGAGRMQVKKDEVVIERPRMRAVSTPAPAAQPRRTTDNSTAQPNRTRTPARQPQVEPVRPVLPPTSRIDTSKKDTSVQNQVRRPGTTATETPLSRQTQTNTRGQTTGNASNVATNRYPQPVPAPAQPKVDPTPRRERITSRTPDAAAQATTGQPANPSRKPANTPAGTASTSHASNADTVRRPNVTAKPKTEPAAQVREDRNANAVKRPVTRQPVAEPPTHSRGPEAAPASPSGSGRGPSDVRPDRSRTVNRTDAGRGDRRGDESDRENSGGRRD